MQIKQVALLMMTLTGCVALPPTHSPAHPDVEAAAPSPSPCTQGEGGGEGQIQNLKTLTLTLSLSTGRGDKGSTGRGDETSTERGDKSASRRNDPAPAIMASALMAAEPRDRYARQLAGECDGLIQAAIRRPYGWGWDMVPAAGPAGKATPRHVAMSPPGSPAAGLLLLWSGQLLDEAKYRQAAMEAARGIAAAQIGSGKIPQHAIFGASAGGRDEPGPVPERAATRAGLTLLLAVIDAEQSKPEALTRPALRAAHWLVKQQSDDGGWPIASGSDADARDVMRLIRLDLPEYRDSTYIMLLAASAIGDRDLTRSAAKSVEKLLSLRLGSRKDQPATDESDDQARRAAQLWSTAYRLDGSIDPKLSDSPAGADVLASRYAMQTLIGAYLMTGEKQAGVALDSAARSLSDLRQPDGWRRIYLTQPTTAPATTQSSGNPFDPPADHSGPWITGSFGLDAMLDSIKQLKLLGREKYTAMLAQQFAVKQHLSAAVCGLSDDPLDLDLPVTKSEIDGYIASHESDWRVLEGPVPEDLGARLHRLWVLLIRAKLERNVNEER